MSAPFHHRLTAALDAAQMDGAHLLPLHGVIRQAMRRANMEGAPVASAEELTQRVARIAPWLKEAAARFAA